VISIKVTLTETKPLVDVKLFERGMAEAVKKTAQAVERDFIGTTRSWTHRPVFKTKYWHGSRAVWRAYVWTDDENYARINFGTRGGYQIPRSGHRKVMAFHPKYRAKSKPGSRVSIRGGSYGKRIIRTGPFTRRKGIAPRQFDKQIAEYRLPYLQDYVDKAVAAAM